MGKTWAIVVLATLLVAVDPPGVSAEEPPSGLSGPKWRQIPSATDPDPLEDDATESDEVLAVANVVYL